VTEASRLRELTDAGLLHANPAAAVSQLFTAGGEFFLAADKVQLKYEMLRAHLADGMPVTDGAVAHGYPRAACYLALASFSQPGMPGLLDERRGRRGPVMPWATPSCAGVWLYSGGRSPDGRKIGAGSG
jgi:hypothetical protein